jgi:hypothetical protein
MKLFPWESGARVTKGRINEAAQAADGAPDFSQRIRASLPTIRR